MMEPFPTFLEDIFQQFSATYCRLVLASQLACQPTSWLAGALAGPPGQLASLIYNNFVSMCINIVLIRINFALICTKSALI